MKIKTLQFNASTLLGILAVVATLAMLFMDMHLSTKETYTFDLQATHIRWGFGVGVGLILVPQEIVTKFVIRLFEKWTS